MISREFEEAIDKVNSVQVNLGNSGHLNQDFTPNTRMNTVMNHVISYNMLSRHADGQIMQ